MAAKKKGGGQPGQPQPAPPAALQPGKCPSCGATNKGTDKYCRYCGSGLTPQQPQGAVDCPHCAKGWHDLGTRMCPNTGKPLEQQLPGGEGKKTAATESAAEKGWWQQIKEDWTAATPFGFGGGKKEEKK